MLLIYDDVGINREKELIDVLKRSWFQKLKRLMNVHDLRFYIRCMSVMSL